MSSADEFGTSVLLPVYLSQVSTEDVRFLKRALESILAQKFPGPYEVIVVDDGSEAPVEGIARAFSSDAALSQVKFIRLRRNSGLVAALNRGLMESHYPFVARIDADDQWLPTKIMKQFSLIQNDSDISITATGMNLVTPGGSKIEAHIRPGDWEGILRFFIDVGCPFPHGSVVARRDVFRLLGGYSHDPAMSHCEDYALWGVWLRFFKPAMVEEALYDYTVSDGSVSVKNREQQLRASREVNAKFAAINAAASIPEVLRELAETLSMSLLNAGIVAYRIWRYRLFAELPPDAVSVLRTLLPDRIVRVVDLPSQRPITVDEILGKATEIQYRRSVVVWAA